jgi:hypothetical protein
MADLVTKIVDCVRVRDQTVIACYRLSHELTLGPSSLHPRLVAAAWMDPTLVCMIQNGLPLTRKQWMSLNWPDGPPHPCARNCLGAIGSTGSGYGNCPEPSAPAAMRV